MFAEHETNTLCVNSRNTSGVINLSLLYYWKLTLVKTKQIGFVKEAGSTVGIVVRHVAFGGRGYGYYGISKKLTLR